MKHLPAFFIDLADPSSRSEAGIRAVLETLPSFEPFPTTCRLTRVSSLTVDVDFTTWHQSLSTDFWRTELP
jgi:hypothetical protein